MNIIANIITFKRKCAEVVNSKKVKDFFEEVTTVIKEYNEFKELTGAEKKQRVDEEIIEYIDDRFYSDNDFVQWIIDQIIEGVPFITQIIYDLLKDKIEEAKEQLGE